MNKKILALLAVLMLSLVPMTVSAYDQNNHASYNVNIVVQTASTFTVTVASTPMSFTGPQGSTNIHANGQTDSAPWATITNTGAGARNFTMGINSAPPAGITLKADDANDMTSAVTLGVTIQPLPGGALLPPSTPLDVWVKANYSASAPIGTHTNNAVIRNYLPVLQSISVSGDTELVAYGTATYTATGTDQEGNSIPLTVTWTATAGSITSAGVFTAPAALGPVIITATDAVTSSTGTITVTIV